MGGTGPSANPAFRADLARSVRLLRAFRTEQADPSGYYTVLAADTVRQLAQYTGLSGRLVLDVGGGPGFFVRAFRAAGARAFVRRHRPRRTGRLRPAGTGQRRGQRAQPAARLRRRGRVLLRQCPGARPGLADDAGRDGAGDQARGASSPSRSPTGCRPGAGTRPRRGITSAATGRPARYQRRHGRPPKNRFGSSLYPVSVADALAAGRGPRTAPSSTTPSPATCPPGPGPCWPSRGCARSSPGTCC